MDAFYYLGETSIACIVNLREYQKASVLCFSSSLSLFWLTEWSLSRFRGPTQKYSAAAALLCFVCSLKFPVVAKRPMGGLRGQNRGMKVEVHEADQLNS